MARVIDGVNGTVSGKVGNVIYYNSNGGNYVRSLPAKRRRKRPPTLKQASQRERFAVVQNWLKPILPLIRIGFNEYAPRQTSHNSAMSYNLQHALLENEGGFEINPEAFAFSRGLLPEAEQASMVQEGDSIRFYWQSNDEIPSDNKLDRTILLLYRPGSDFANYRIYGNERWQLTDSLTINEFKAGDILYGYLAFISSESQEVSNSVYLGRLEVEKI
jgi:hypothetical protein